MMMSEQMEGMMAEMMAAMMPEQMEAMMSFHLTNFVSLLVAAALAFVVGGIWYGPLFGKTWQAERAHKKGKKIKGAGLGMVVQGLHLIVVGFVVFALAHFTTAWCAFVMLGLMTILGMVSAGIFLEQSRKLVLLNIGQHLLTLAIFALAALL